MALKEPWENTTWTTQANNAGQIKDDGYLEFYLLSQFITGKVCFPVLCVVGISGNILSLIVLSQKKMLTSTNVYLSALAVGDTIKLVNDALYFIYLIVREVNPDAAESMMGHMYPISHYVQNQSVCVTSWLTVSVAVERYISVCHPTRAKEMCTVHRAKIVSIFVFIGMSFVALPALFRYKTITKINPSNNKTVYDVNVTELWQNPKNAFIFSWSINLIRTVIPLLVLIIFNSCIIRALRRQRVKGKTISARNRITLMLITVVILFLICVTPDAIMSTFLGFGYYDETNLVKGTREITDTLLVLNSAINFVVYCAWSLIFRQTFMEMFCRSLTPYSNKGYSIADQSTMIREERRHSDHLHLPLSTHTKSPLNCSVMHSNGRTPEEQSLI